MGDRSVHNAGNTHFSGVWDSRYAKVRHPSVGLEPFFPPNGQNGFSAERCFRDAAGALSLSPKDGRLCTSFHLLSSFFFIVKLTIFSFWPICI